MSNIKNANENVNVLAQEIVDIEKKKIESNYVLETARIDHENKKLEKFTDLEDKRLKIMDKQINSNRRFAYCVFLSIMAVFVFLIILSFFKEEYMNFIYDILKILLGGIVGFAIKTIFPKKQ